MAKKSQCARPSQTLLPVSLRIAISFAPSAFAASRAVFAPSYVAPVHVPGYVPLYGGRRILQGQTSGTHPESLLTILIPCKLVSML